MTDQVPQTTEEQRPPAREPLPFIHKFPAPHEQELVDAILRDPLTSEAEHLQRIRRRYGGEPYKTRTTAASRASKILAKPVVAAYMRAQQQRLREAADLEENDLLEMLTQIMRTDITQICWWDEDGEPHFRKVEDLPNHARRAIKKIKFKETTQETKNGSFTERSAEFELYSVMDAMKLYAQIAGLLGDDERGGVYVAQGVIYLNAPATEQEALRGKVIHEG